MEDFESYRPLLFSIAYRMLGSAGEAGAAVVADLDGAESACAESAGAASAGAEVVAAESDEARTAAAWAESPEEATGAAPVSGSGARLEHPEAMARHAPDTTARVRLWTIRNVIRFPRVVRDTRPSM